MELVQIVQRLLPGAEPWTEDELSEARAFLDAEVAKLAPAEEPAPVAEVESVPSPAAEVTPALAVEETLPTEGTHTGEVDYSTPAPAPEAPVTTEPEVPVTHGEESPTPDSES